MTPLTPVSEIVIFDNLKIQKKQNTSIQKEISIEGSPCSTTFRLSVELEQNSTYQWYKDSLPIIGDTSNILILNSSLAAINSHYHLAIIDNNGNCQLIPYKINEPLEVSSEENITLCEGDVYQIGNTIINSVGEHRFTQTLTTTSDVCDSIVSVFVNILPSSFFSFSDTINEGDFYNFDGISLSEAGIFQNTISNSKDCDSIITLNLFVRPAPSFFSYSEAICQGESLSFAGKTLTNPGIYRDTLVNFAGVDSFITLNLRVIPIATFSFEKELCTGETYQFGDTVLTTSGQYIQAFKTLSFGCDSLVRINIYFLEPVQGDTLSVSQFQGTAYTFHGNTYTESGIYEATLTANNGCDSIAYLHLTFTDPCAIPIDISIESADTDCEAASNGWLELLITANNPPYQYSINNGLTFSENPLFDNLSVGNYEVVVIDNNACESRGQATIQIGTSNLLVRLPNDTSLFEGQSIQLAIEEINFEPTAYHWSADTRINCPTCPSILLNLPSSEILTLTVTDENGCQTTNEIFIEIKKAPQLYIPNAFSPNSDGNNDYFKIEGKPETLNQIEEMQIFNRWGNLVFQQQADNQSTIGWDGYIHNKKAMEDVYIYMIKWVNPKGEAEILRGDFMLFR